MGLNSTSKCLITLRRQDQHLIIEKINENQLDNIHPAEKYYLPSLFSLLEDSLVDNQHCLFKNGLLKITILDLSFCELTELPKTLKLLHLTVLNVSNNKLTKIPSCLYAGGLKSLESLDLSHNQITQFDIQPDCVTNLKCLKLNNNQFTNLPRWFLTFRCISLEELNYSENNAIHYNFLKHSCNFQVLNLKKLVLKSACLIDNDFIWLQLLKNLEFLDISNGKLCERFINKFKELPLLFRKPLWHNLKVLNLSHLKLAFLPEDLFWITSLKELYVSHNFLSWFPDGIEYLEKLEVLDVSHNELILLPNLIKQLESLRILIASHNKLDEMPQMPANLEVLDVYDNYITNISDLEQVKHLDLDCNCIDMNCDDYYTKRNLFRTLYNKTDRINYIKTPKYTDEYYSEHSSSDSDSEYEECEELDNHTPSTKIEEDWNTEYIPTTKNQTIEELSDNDFTGYCEIQKPSLKPSYYLYCEDEDWIFEDAD